MESSNLATPGFAYHSNPSFDFIDPRYIHTYIHERPLSFLGSNARRYTKIASYVKKACLYCVYSCRPWTCKKSIDLRARHLTWAISHPCIDFILPYPGKYSWYAYPLQQNWWCLLAVIHYMLPYPVARTTPVSKDSWIHHPPSSRLDVPVPSLAASAVMVHSTRRKNGVAIDQMSCWLEYIVQLGPV